MKLSRLLTAQPNPDKPTSQNRLMVWIIPFVSFVLLAVTFIYIVYPWYLDAEERRKETNTQKQKAENLQQKLTILNSYEEDTLKEYLLRLSLAVPTKDSPPLVLASVEQALNSVGMVLETAQYGGSTEDENSEEPSAADTAQTNGEVPETTVEEELRRGDVNLIVSARGDFSSVTGFLKTIETINPLMVGVDVRSSKVESGSNPNPDSQLPRKLSFQGIAPYQELPADLGAISSPISRLSSEDVELIQSLNQYVTFYEVQDAINPDRFTTGKENPF